MRFRLAISGLLVLCFTLRGEDATSSLREVDTTPATDKQWAEIIVDCIEAGKPEHKLAVRVIVTASDGSHADGSGNGLYSDGRFFADGSFTLKVPAGETKLVVRAGPNFVPLETRLSAVAGKTKKFEASLHRWFSPEERGWFAGDNHVHVKHDATGKIKTSYPYTALQGRANGLSYITEAGSSLASRDGDFKDRPDFLLRHAQELRPGPFVGHRNTPGLREAFLPSRFEKLVHQPLPTLALLGPVHNGGGAVIYTHPMTPPHLLHWMGATEAWSNGVLGRCADAFDIDGRHTEWLWFSLLNMGNRVAASGSTDAALERLQTPVPGDRRVYAQAGKLSYESCVAAIRSGKTFATNGGPLFTFISIGTYNSGDVIELAPQDNPGVLRAEIHALYPLKKVVLISNGAILKEFDAKGKSVENVFTHPIVREPTGQSWYVLRAEDERGNWAITSPIYLRTKDQAEQAPDATFTMLSIANHSRFIELRKDFFAHAIVTCRAGIESVELLRDETIIQIFQPADGNKIVNDVIPVTGIFGDYAPGWIWHKENTRPVHLQADIPVTATGAYSLRIRTAGKTILSDAIIFDAQATQSRAISVAILKSGKTNLTYWGYGEEMPLADIRLPFKGDHWWYPKNTFWRMVATLGNKTEETGGGQTERRSIFVPKQ